MATIDESLRRVPPQSLEAEEAVLGGILLASAALDRVTALVQADDFYREAHRKVFRAMLDLSARNEPADLITLAEVLKARSELADVGGSAYLAELAERVPTAAHVAQYARIVRDKSILRALIGAATEIAVHGYEGRDDVGEMLDRAEQLIFGISDRKVKPEFVRISDLLVESLKTIERWRPLAEIRPGHRIAVPRRIDVFGERSIGMERAKLLGYLLGDGTLTGPCARFTNSDPRLHADFREAVQKVGGLAAREHVP